MNHRSLNQLLCAATVNGRFREVLLRDPARALSIGYDGQSFALTPEEKQLVLGIRARRLEEFAAQVYEWLSASRPTDNRDGRSTKRSAPSLAEHAVEPYRIAALTHA
jgi:hypothetical protein